MSQTFRHKGRRVDFDLWMYPDLSLDLDFDLLASMVTGTFVSPPFGGAEAIATDVADFVVTEVKQSFQLAAGLFMTAWGTAMLIPGPGDYTAMAVGGWLGGPVGAIIGLVLYNVFALVVLGIGIFLVYTA